MSLPLNCSPGLKQAFHTHTTNSGHLQALSSLTQSPTMAPDLLLPLPSRLHTSTAHSGNLQTFPSLSQTPTVVTDPLLALLSPLYTNIGQPKHLPASLPFLQACIQHAKLTQALDSLPLTIAAAADPSPSLSSLLTFCTVYAYHLQTSLTTHSQDSQAICKLTQHVKKLQALAVSTSLAQLSLDMHSLCQITPCNAELSIDTHHS